MTQTTEQTKAELEVSAAKMMNRLEAVGEMVDIATFRFNEDGVHVSETVDHNARYIEVSVTAGEDDIDVPEPFALETSAHTFLRKIKNIANRHDTLEIRYYYRQKSLYVAVGGPQNQAEVEFDVVSDPDAAGLDKDFEYDVEARAPSYELRGAVEAIAHRSQRYHAPVGLVARDGGLDVTMWGGNKPINPWTVPEATVSTDLDEVVSLYSSDYLLDVVRGLPADFEVEFRFGNTYPLEVEVTDEWRYIIAPRNTKESEVEW